MSVDVTSWAWKQNVGDAGAKLVLVKLADQANDDGECYPSHKKLARDCEMSRRTVQRKLEVLYEAGLVSAEERKRDDGGDTSLLYRLSSSPHPVRRDAPVRQIDAPPRVTRDAPPAPLVTHHEPSVEPRATAEAVPRSGPERKPRARDPIWDTLEELFGTVAAGTNAHARRNRAVSDLRKFEATPITIRQARAAWNSQKGFPNATCTDIALATHYPQLASAIRAALHSPACTDCGVGGGDHTADCPVGQARLEAA